MRNITDEAGVLIESKDILKDFKNVFASANGQRVFLRMLHETGLFSAESNNLELKKYGAWMIQMIGGDNVNAIPSGIVKTLQAIKNKGEE